jgi:hypothetical protein
LAGTAAVAHATPVFIPQASQINLISFVEYIEDAEGSLTFADFRGREQRGGIPL